MAELSGLLHRQFRDIVERQRERRPKELLPGFSYAVFGIPRIVLALYDLDLKTIDSFLTHAELGDSVDCPDAINQRQGINNSAVGSNNGVIRAAFHPLQNRKRATASAFPCGQHCDVAGGIADKGGLMRIEIRNHDLSG